MVALNYTPAQISPVLAQGNALMQSIGYSQQPLPGYQPVSVNRAGKQQFVDSNLIGSPDGTLGAKSLQVLQGTLDPFGVFSGKDKSVLDGLATVSSDASFITQLSDLRARGDTKGFVNAILAKTGQPIINAITSDPQDRAGLGGAFSAYQLYQNWGNLSPAQKGLGVANLGIQGFKYSTGENLAAKSIIPADPTSGNPGMTVGQGLGLFQAGYNTYSLAKNWNQLNGLQKVTGATADAASIANLAESFNMLGAGTAGAEVAGVTSQTLAQAGWAASPSMGIGAISAPVGTQIPTGYATITQAGGNVVAAPAGTAASAEGAATTSAGSVLGTAAGVAGIAAGTYSVYKGWGTGGTKGATNGALGGASIAAGMYALGATNPFLLAGIVAISVAGNLAKTGKEEHQVARDGVRSVFKDSGAVDDDYNFTLPDGTKANIGMDGHSGEHKVHDPSKIPAGEKVVDTLHAYDADYTNDLDYTAAWAGTALSRIKVGGKATNVDQMGGAIGNAALTNIGYGKEYSQGNYNTLMNNLRSMYAQSGIGSKADAYQLANQAYAEGRLSESDTVAAHQAFNLIFDQGSYATAQSLMAGRFNGLKAAATQPTETTVKVGPVNDLMLRFPAGTKLPGNLGQGFGGTAPNGSPIVNYSAPSTKEDARARNRELYQRVAA